MVSRAALTLLNRRVGRQAAIVALSSAIAINRAVAISIRGGFEGGRAVVRVGVGAVVSRGSRAKLRASRASRAGKVSGKGIKAVAKKVALPLAIAEAAFAGFFEARAEFRETGDKSATAAAAVIAVADTTVFGSIPEERSTTLFGAPVGKFISKEAFIDVFR